MSTFFDFLIQHARLPHDQRAGFTRKYSQSLCLRVKTLENEHSDLVHRSRLALSSKHADRLALNARSRAAEAFMLLTEARSIDYYFR